ncbi:hypothetical protein EON63_08030 [archaeon]|nr:MAG: hypothetical protein EON63_08030 [archaeon]
MGTLLAKGANLRQMKEIIDIEEDLDVQLHQETFIGGWDVSLQPGFTFSLTYNIQLPSLLIFDDNAPIAISEATHNILHERPAPYWVNTQVGSISSSKQVKDTAMKTTTFHTTVVTALNPTVSKHDLKLSQELMSSLVSAFKDGRFKEQLLKLMDEKKSRVFQKAKLLNVNVKVLEDITAVTTASYTTYFVYSNMTTMVLCVFLAFCLMYMYTFSRIMTTPPPTPYKRKTATTNYV